MIEAAATLEQQGFFELSQRFDREKSAWPYWLAAVLTTVAILVMVPIARPMQNFLKHQFGTWIFKGIGLVFLTFAVILFYRFVWKSGGMKRCFFFLILALLYVWRFFSLDVDVERIHLLEYGLLSVFTAIACSRHGLGFLAYAWGALAAAIVGLADEYYQFLTPDRYGEFRDILINLEGGVLGLLTLKLLGNPEGLKPSPTRHQVAGFLISASLVAILSGVFFLRVQVFGRMVEIAGVARFRTFFDEPSLKSRTTFDYFVQLNRKNNPGMSRPEDGPEIYWYEREAREHFDRVVFLMQSGDRDAAKREMIIAEGFFRPYLVAKKLDWDESVRSGLQNQELQSGRIYTSPVVNFMIVTVDRNRVKTITWTVFVTLLLTGMLFLIPGKKRLPADPGSK